MPSHSFHPNIQTHGLADNCERCLEISADPVYGLDHDTLRVLVRRFGEGYPPRSGAEAGAFARLRETMDRAARISRIMEETLDPYPEARL